MQSDFREDVLPAHLGVNVLHGVRIVELGYSYVSLPLTLHSEHSIASAPYHDETTYPNDNNMTKALHFFVQY
jgi:hypothetical protein